MNVREMLLELTDAIVCNKCGNCCPDVCPSKQKNLCLEHPSCHDGQELRGSTCSLSPVELTILSGVACEPVGDKIKELTGVTIQIKKESQMFGSESIRFDPIQLESILNQEI